MSRHRRSYDGLITLPENVAWGYPTSIVRCSDINHGCERNCLYTWTWYVLIIPYHPVHSSRDLILASGMGGCLSVSSNAAKALAAALCKPLVGIHHMVCPPTRHTPRTPHIPHILSASTRAHPLFIITTITVPHISLPNPPCLRWTYSSTPGAFLCKFPHPRHNARRLHRKCI